MRSLLYLIGFAAVSVLTLWLGFIAIPVDDALGMVRRWGYWAIAFSTLTSVAGLGFIFRHSIVVGWEDFCHRRWRLWWLFPAVLAACLIFALTREEAGFKIVMDEPILVGTSQVMHESRLLFTPTRAYNYEGAFTLSDGFIDKRPNLFPFLLSVVHDVSGYRVGNVFVLNALLGLALLALVYGFGVALKVPWVGLWGMVALIALPLFITNINGGGFETLNLVVIMLLLLVSMRCLKQPDAAGITAVMLTAVLLVQVRYESALYLLTGGLVVLVSWARAGRIVFPPWLIPLPLLLVPWLWQYKTFQQREDFWQLDDFEGVLSPFSMDYVATNFAHALAFFFDPDRATPNLIGLALAGSVAVIIVAVVYLARIRSFSSWTVAEQGFFLLLAGFAANWILLLTYFYGQLDLPIIRRLSLPFYLMFVLAVMILLARAVVWRRFVAPVAWAGLALVLAIETLPKTAAQIYRQEYLAGREIAAVRDYIERNQGQDYFVLSENAMVWIIHRVPALSFGRANLQPGAVKFFMEQDVSPLIKVHERAVYNPNTRAFEPLGKELLRPEFKRRQVEYWNFTPSRGAGISLLTEVDVPLPEAPAEFPTERDWVEYYYGNLP